MTMTNNYLHFWCLAVAAVMAVSLTQAQPPVHHSRIGETITAQGGVLTITNVGKKQNFDWRDTATRDEDVFSPKSVNFHHDG